MRRLRAGFTLIELLIVISILGVLASVLMPELDIGRAAATSASDAMQLRTHGQWLEMHRLKHNGSLPDEGGHRFVLATWISGVVPHTEEAFDKYFAPGSRDNDPVYQQKREVVARGGNPWPDHKSVGPDDTHYAGRSRQHLRTASGAGEAWMADDNDGLWTHRDGTVNLLLADGNVRTLSYQILAERFSLGPFDKNNPIQTWGPNSPIPECQKLDQ